MDVGSPGFLGSTRGRWLAAALLLVATALLFARVGGYPFVYFDDNRYLTENPQVRAGLTWDGVAWAFTSLQVSNWHPLTWLSHMADVQVFGLDAGAHHLVNVALHALNAALLFLVLARMTGAAGRSFVVAALFAVHPLHVESVAWIAERKDVLSTLFGILALGAWTAYARGPALGRYLLVVLLFAASLMAKPMWVTLPCLLLLLDAWPLQRLEGSPIDPDPEPSEAPRFPLRRLLLEKVPLLALSVASSAVTVVAQHRGGAVADLQLGLGARLGNAAVSYASYLLKAFWPSPLAVFYPHPKDGLAAWQVAGALVLLGGVTAAVVWRARRLPWLALGWFWFLGTLVPVIGVVQVGAQAMADRYTYLPAVGLFVAVAWLGHRLAGERHVAMAAAAAAAGLVAFSAVTWRQIGLWSNHEVLFEHALAVTPDNALAHGVLSQGLRNQGKLEKALLHAREAVRLDPASARHWQNLGVSLRDLRMHAEARDAFRRAIDVDPGYAIAWANLGQAELDLGNLQGAMAAAGEAMRLAPREAQGLYVIGLVQLATGQVDGAVRLLGEAVRLKPDYVAAWTQLAILQERSGRIAEAGESFRSAAASHPEDPVVWRNLGVFRAKYGQADEAVRAFAEALRRKPGDADLLHRLGLVLVSQGRPGEALEIAGRLDGVDPTRAADLRARLGGGR
jgi:Flp pilus assembly protein TadD